MFQNQRMTTQKKSIYGKAQLGAEHNETKILGLTWDKTADTLDATFPKLGVDSTKRGILQKFASCYDPVGWKIIYREVSQLGTRWDQQLSEAMFQKWNKWNNLLEKTVVPRVFSQQRKKIEVIDFHGFIDASTIGATAALYAVICQLSGTSQGLEGAKSRLAKKNLTLPRLELVAMHMAPNLCKNIKDSLEEKPIGKFYGWIDSSVALCWTKEGNYKQFVSNRVNKTELSEKYFINWRHVPTDRNSADIGSQGCNSDKSPVQWWS